MAILLQYFQIARFTTYISINITRYFIDLVTDINRSNTFSTTSIIHVITYVTLVLNIFIHNENNFLQVG